MDKVVLNGEVHKVWDGDDYDTHPSHEGYTYYAAWIKPAPCLSGFVCFGGSKCVCFAEED